jgi:hypothetical protein
MSLVVIRLEYCRKPILQKVRLIGIAAQPNAFDAATQPADGDANN